MEKDVGPGLVVLFMRFSLNAWRMRMGGGDEKEEERGRMRRKRERGWGGVGEWREEED